jgi:hypothetical protein
MGGTGDDCTIDLVVCPWTRNLSITRSKLDTFFKRAFENETGFAGHAMACPLPPDCLGGAVAQFC